MKPSTRVEAKQRQMMIDGRKLPNQIEATKGRATSNQIMAYNSVWQPFWCKIGCIVRRPVSGGN